MQRAPLARRIWERQSAVKGQHCDSGRCVLPLQSGTLAWAAAGVERHCTVSLDRGPAFAVPQAQGPVLQGSYQATCRCIRMQRRTTSSLGSAAWQRPPPLSSSVSAWALQMCPSAGTLLYGSRRCFSPRSAPEGAAEADAGTNSHSPSVAPHSVQCRQWSWAARAVLPAGCSEPACPWEGPEMGQTCQPQMASTLARCRKPRVKRSAHRLTSAPGPQQGWCAGLWCLCAAMQTGLCGRGWSLHPPKQSGVTAYVLMVLGPGD